jgi:anti-sigma factor RsiW
MKCEQVTAWLLAYLDGEVTDRQRDEIEVHLAGCPTCAAELEELAALQAHLSTMAGAAREAIHLPAASEARVTVRLADRLEQAQSHNPLAAVRGWLGRRSWLVARALAVLLLVAFIAAAILVTHPPRLAQPPLPELDLQETVLLGQASFAPGSLAAVRVLVRQMPEGTPVPQAEVTLSLAPEGRSDEAVELFVGRTDDSGTLPVSFRVPDDLDEGRYTLIVETRSDVGSDRLEQAITLRRSYRLLLTTDKPLYQPGQVIHMRVLALTRVDRQPAAGQPIEFTVEDPKENTLLRQQVVASVYGLAALDFALSSEASHGPYRLSATLGDTTSERVVTVGDYVLPKFGLQIETDRSYYLPGDRVEGHVQAGYFFGKPVSGGQVELRGVVYDVERSEEVFLHGKTDDEGRFAFAFDLPAYFAGGTLESGVAHFGLEVSVTDQAEHTEETSCLLPVSDQVLVIEAVPESGQLKPGVENIVYLLTSYPDGSPAEAVLSASYGRETVELRTGAYGLAELRLLPSAEEKQWLAVTATDADGNQGSRSLALSAEPGPDHLLLRPERAIYRVGETLAAEVLADQPVGTVYLDLVREGQTMLTQAAALEQGRAILALDLTPDLAGTLELHAYQVRPDGSLVRDTRIVVVDAPVELSLEVGTNREAYRPGDTALLSFDVTGPEGQGVQAALGVGIVDESVYALQELDPGFAKTYFLLEKILAEPRYQIKGFSWSSLAGEAAEVESPLVEAQNASAAAALAEAPDPAFELQASSYPAKAQEAEMARQEWEQQGRLQQAEWARRARWLVDLAFVAIPLLLAGIVLLDLRRQRRTLRRMAWAAGFLLLISPLLLYGGRFLLEKLERPALAFALFWGLLEAALILLAVEAWRQRYQGLKLAVVLMAGYLATISLIFVELPDLVFGPSLDRGLMPNLALGLGTLLLLALWLKSRARRLLIIISIFIAVLAILAGAIVSLTLQSTKGLPSASGQTVVVARQPIASGSIITADLVGVTVWLDPPRGAARRVPDVLGATTRRDIAQGEVILMQDLGIPLGFAPTWTPMPTPQGTRTPQPGEGTSAGPTGAGATPEPPRLRQWFPETLYWNPEAVTDEDGHLELPVALADSITTWRLSALANSQDGRLGGATIPLGVFQDFFVDLDLPVALTQHDEIAVPVAVYNYLPQTQTLRLEIAPAPWFELLSPPTQEITLGATDIDVIYFRIRARDHGRQRLTVTAWGTEMSDAVSREVRVEPDGKRFREAVSDWLEDGEEQVVAIPAAALPGASRIEVKVYPGPVSQVVEGLERILRMPFG